MKIDERRGRGATRVPLAGSPGETDGDPFGPEGPEALPGAPEGSVEAQELELSGEGLGGPGGRWADSSFADLLAWVVGPPARARVFRGRPPGWWLRAGARELARETGLGGACIERIRGALELARRVLDADRGPRRFLGKAAEVHTYLAPVYAGLEREAFHVMLLDGQHRLKRCELVSLGTLTASLVHPREVFRRAVREAAAAVIVAHNHPSGDPKPSREDREVTRRLREAGELLGIPLLDHLVIAGDRYTSLREVLGF